MDAPQQEAMLEYPYLQEMKERLVSQGADPEQLGPRITTKIYTKSTITTKTKSIDKMDKDVLEVHHDTVGTVVKLNSGGYGSHTSPAHVPLISREPRLDHTVPKNAK